MNVKSKIWKQGSWWMGLLLTMAMVTGCGSIGSDLKSPAQPQGVGGASGISALGGTNASAFVAQIPLGVGDSVTVSFPDMQEVSKREFREKIRDDGTVILPLNVQVQAAGKTVSVLQDLIHDAYVPKYYNHLTVSVKSEERFYYVGGEVRTPNRFLYIGEITVLRAIDSAGGFTDFANKKAIELRRANGEFHTIDYKKAKRNPKLDLQVFPNDQIIVRDRLI